MHASLLPLLTAAQLGPTLVSARKARRISQAALAERIGLSQSRVSYLELHPGDLSVDQLMAWCAALGLELTVGAREAAHTGSAGTVADTPAW
ncbi:helix-turn-helix domain-containing protein [Aquabacterium fontiphilum]|jgi:HTH-type transcriptional regulator/antitoxin HipB|uniref:helix-turn-helix domain-containing protein n=1 Tax=Aquabacterium fontiphilum TaxID=450365 RepID=UPI001376D32D|nr:helix-turn-helix transcriptional regulator [Aquabacterium fontiphilum]NBD22161.1 helix-turn-helix domain-containing protein [Aquabacterium fontiphilum]